LGLVEVDPAVGDNTQPGLGLECRSNALVTEPDALELGLLVLEREVGVASGRDRDPADLALDPQVAQALVGTNQARDDPGRLGDAEDPEAERPRSHHGTAIGTMRLVEDVHSATIVRVADSPGIR
jgi:hypothetical protein